MHDMPFDENTMTIIMGLGGPGEPGHHGPMEAPMPEGQAVDLIIKIKDMCEDYLMKCGKASENKSEEPDYEQPEED